MGHNHDANHTVDEDAPKTASGVISDNPAQSLPIGRTIYFRNVEQLSVPLSAAQSVKNWEVFEGALLALVFGTSQTSSIDGSAVMVAPGVALCARHVVEPMIESLLSGKIGCICFGITSSGLRNWQIRKLTVVPGTDVAILGLELASDASDGDIFWKTALTARIPKVEEQVSLYGFHAAQPTFNRTEQAASFRGHLIVSAGLVTQCFMLRRDDVMLPWPAIEVACPAVGGMSGGPVFDSSGNLIGLVCSSVESEAGGGQHMCR